MILYLQSVLSLNHNRKGAFQNTYLGGILIAVAFLNAFIEFYQLQKSEAILASFLAMIPPSCRVVRDRSIMSIPAAELVKGDVVLLVRVYLPSSIFPRPDGVLFRPACRR